MAIVNHTGVIAADETWAATDEHHITGNIIVDGIAAPGPRITVESEVILNWDGDFQMFGEDQGGAQNYAHFYAVAADWDHKILSRADPTIYPEPVKDQYGGLNTANGLAVTLLYYHIRNSDWGFAFLSGINLAAGLNRGVVNIQKSLIEYSQNPLVCRCSLNDADAVDFTYKNNIHRFCYDGFFTLLGVDNNPGTVFTGAFDVDRCFSYQMYGVHVGEGVVSCAAYFDWPFDMTNWVFDGGTNVIGRYNTFFLTFMAGYTAMDWTNCYFGNFQEVPAYSATLGGLVLFQSEDNEKITFTECVVDVQSIFLFLNWIATGNDIDWDANDCDFYNSKHKALYGKAAAGRGNVVDSFFIGNNFMPTAQIDHTADEAQYQEAEASHTVSVTPNKPLDIENVVEGAPGIASITITYDSEVGPQGRRCDGSAFIKYGTVSGVYTERTSFPSELEERAFAWTRIKTDHLAFKQMNHSVTISNLTPGTTYYYKCCFIDPLGRVAEGAEGSFATTGSAVVRRDVSPSFSIRRA